ncbi:MAG: hypothetical protein VB039_09175 [Oscillospiraceae bacterium]|nr:hypothetical protein [Oscillospiraceae bacterium]
MNMSCSEPAKDCLHELSTVLAQNHFEVSPSEDGALSVIFGGERLCRIVDGEVRYYPDDVKSHEKEDAFDRVAGIAQTVSEYMRSMEIAPTLKASGLDADFKLLAEFNDCVLAGRFSGEGRGVQFVTWEWGYDRKGLYHGHYFENDYEGAKADFAQRSGLIDRNHFFTDEQLRLISQSVEEVLDASLDISAADEGTLKDIQRQIGYTLPEPSQMQGLQFNM